MQKYKKYEDLMAPWKNDQKTRDDLIARIRSQSSKTSELNANQFTQERVIEEYYKAWLEQPASSLQKIAQHPLLTKQLRAKIDQEVFDQKQSMLKWSAGLTSIFVILYSAFFSRMPRFAKFFNNPDSYMITRGMKKTLGVYGLFLCCVASLTSSYEKALPQKL